MEVFELYIQTHFSAAHALKGYEGECAKVHGHNWIIEVFVRCERLNDIGIGMDFRVIKQAVKEVIQHEDEALRLDHANLSEHPAFVNVNPTSEHIARYIYRELSKKIHGDGIRISKIKVSETPGAGAYYWEE